MCVQPPHGGVVAPVQPPPFLPSYAEQRIFFQGVAPNRTVFSVMLLLVAIARDRCAPLRLALLERVWFDGDRYHAVQTPGLGTPARASPFAMSPAQFHWPWRAAWPSPRALHLRAPGISLNVSNIQLLPQGSAADQRIGPGYVPTDDAHAAFSFSGFHATVEALVGRATLTTRAVYIESVAETEPIPAGFACLYLLASPRDALFLCDTLSGPPSPFARGMRVHSGKRTWYAAGTFSVRALGPPRYSPRANASFPTLYRGFVPHVADFVMTPLAQQQALDFGMRTSAGARWAQETALQWRAGRGAFRGARGLLGLMAPLSTIM